MKKITIFLICLFSISLMLSSAHSKIKSTEIKSEGLGEFKQIHFGKLNLDKNQWKELGYKTEKEWLTDIKTIEESFKTYLKKYVKKKTLSFAIDSKMPKGSELDVSFSKPKIDRGYKFMLGPWGSIETTMTIENVKTKKVVYKALLWGRKSGGFGFVGQMKGASRVLAKDISKVLKK